MLPNFLLVGAPKSGTTSISNYLGQHPDIFMCAEKEVGFFWAYGEDFSNAHGPGLERLRNRVVQNLEQYEALFKGVKHEQAVGESSVRYLSNSRSPELIHSLIPQAKIIVNLRQPADRAFSSFVHNLQDGVEPCKEFQEAVLQERLGLRDGWLINRHLLRGFYSASLIRYLQYFDRQQMHISIFEDLKDGPQELISSIYKFLNVEDSFMPDISKRYNVSGLILNPGLRFGWMRSSGLRSVIRKLFSPRQRQMISGWVLRNSIKPSFSAELRAELIEYYRRDIEELQILLDRDLSSWFE